MLSNKQVKFDIKKYHKFGGLEQSTFIVSFFVWVRSSAMTTGLQFPVYEVCKQGIARTGVSSEGQLV